MLAIGRREFIALISGVAAAWPLAAQAQQPARMRRIGVLMSVAADDPRSPVGIAAFLQGMAELGWTDRRNMVIDYRWAAGEAERYRKFASELVELSPDVIVAAGVVAAAALQQMTRSIPIVFVSAGDPVGSGLVASLARPGGNLTGFATFEYGLRREVAGAAQANRARCQASRHSSGSDHPGRHRPACRNPDGSALLSSGIDFDRRARFRRDRTRRHGVRSRPQRRFDRDYEYAGYSSSPAHHYAGSSVWLARRLFLPPLCR